MDNYVRPAIMSGPMALNTMLSLKQVTRRLSGLELINLTPDEYELKDHIGRDHLGRRLTVFTHKTTRKPVTCACPYGDADDFLYIRENWAVGKGYDDVRPKQLPNPKPDYLKMWFEADGPYPELAGKRRPAIHLPKIYCRTWVAVLSVKVERLQDIDEEQAMYEGVEVIKEGQLMSYKNYLQPTFGYILALHSFKSLWTKINGPLSWERNPWVWVVSFHKIPTP